MSFYTSLSGLNAAQTDLNTTSNNIANVGTVGFKYSRAEFGDLISSSVTQAQSATVGQGTRVSDIAQNFNQGSSQQTGRALDLMMNSDGFFVTKAATGGQVSYTRNGSFTVDDQNDIVDSTGAMLQALPVDQLGNVLATGPGALSSLQVSPTNGTPKATSSIDLSMTFPASADLPSQRSAYTSTAPYAFDPKDTNSYNYATSITTYDASGTAEPASVYYVRDTKPATDGTGDQSSTWTAHMVVGDKEVFPTGATTAQTLTFDANGTLTSPTTATTFNPILPTGASAPMTLTVDYGTATKQGGYPFQAVASSQDGNSTGKLTNLSVSASGLVSATYSNSQTVALGKLAVAKFTNPNGLHQAGNTNWTETSASGAVQIGEAGVDGRGSISSGALEISNVDLTEQLVNLISAQRNFQANAKAIDTDKQMISSILNLQ